MQRTVKWLILCYFVPVCIKQLQMVFGWKGHPCCSFSRHRQVAVFILWTVIDSCLTIYQLFEIQFVGINHIGMLLLQGGVPVLQQLHFFLTAFHPGIQRTQFLS